ncbi:MAG: hypothetical protein KDA80_18080, partial [Planctomycetaceae bacterium]|nr:hypothetical protein [Planctomycetaceae bacterium]
MTDVPSHSRTARWGWVCMLLTVLIATGKATWGQSDGLARSVIVDEQILAENIEFIREQLRELSSEQQFDLLKGCVLPGDSHPTIRLSGKFQTPEPHTSGSIRTEPSDSFRFLVSPVSDLLDVAESLDRLDEITDQVKAYDPTDEPQIRARLALLTLLAIRRQNENESDRYCHELTLRVARQPLPKLADRWPETLVTWEAMRQKSLLPQAETLLFQIMESQVRKNHCAGPGEWNLAMGGLLGRIREFQSDSESDSPGLQNLSSNKLERWAPVTKDNVWHAGTHV